jgi:hypothetical protein
MVHDLYKIIVPDIPPHQLSPALFRVLKGRHDRHAGKINVDARSIAGEG